jgi:hypothetical protein
LRVASLAQVLPFSAGVILFPALAAESAFGIAALERDRHVDVHLENNVLFPPAAGLASRMAGQLGTLQ